MGLERRCLTEKGGVVACFDLRQITDSAFSCQDRDRED